MKERRYILGLFAVAWFLAATACAGKQKEPWRADQLMPPEELAAIIDNPTAVKPLIISVGPAGLISGSVEVSQVKEQENLDKLKGLLSKQEKDRDIVLYCGCCPFKDCPNIRPAFSLANSKGFTNHKLLNLSHNLKVDWIDHGYPITDVQ